MPNHQRRNVDTQILTNWRFESWSVWATLQTGAAVEARGGNLILQVRGHSICLVAHQVERFEQVAERRAHVDASTTTCADLESPRHLQAHG